MTDIAPEIFPQAMARITKSVEKLAARGVIDETQKEAALQIGTTVKLDTARDADLIIEAATEKPEVKLQLFSDPDDIAAEKTIPASNTFSIPLTKVGAATNRPDRVLGMHFLTPSP